MASFLLLIADLSSFFVDNAVHPAEAILLRGYLYFHMIASIDERFRRIICTCSFTIYNYKACSWQIYLNIMVVFPLSSRNLRLN